jgi:outer membrane immunogenic protein
MKTTVLAFALLAGMSTAAFATDLAPYPVEPTAPISATSYDWSGAYVGIQGGYGFNGEADWDINEGTANVDLGQETDGWSVGAIVGYNVQFGMIVVGAEGTLNYSDLSGDKTIEGVELATDMNYFGTATARLGLALDNVLIYGKGGYAGANIGPSIDADSSFSWSDDQFHHGWVAGLGVEFAMTQNLVIGLEYTHMDFGSETYTVEGVDALDVALTDDRVNLRLAYKF